jgi:Predicted O-methyltransferase
VLEIGTSSGYSTLWIADALLSVRSTREAPSVTTIEADPAKVKWASDNFRAAGIDSIATIMEGNAITILPQLRATKKRFDFVLIDADKENIVKYFDLVLPMVMVGGIIAADNMLIPAHFRPRMKKYASYVSSNPSVQSVTVPIGMGEEITLKLS